MGPHDERFELASLGDLMEMLAEGWRIDHLYYADRSAGTGPPAAFFDLSRGPGEQQGVYVPDDGRALSHRALVSLFRESPHIWKHRSADAIPRSEPEPDTLTTDWAEVPEPFPQALTLCPATLRDVVPVNQVQSIDGLDIALTALERYQAGARLRFMCQASDPRAGRPRAVLDVIAVDDAARLYRVAPIDTHPEGDRLEGALVVAPAIPPDVRRLTVTVGTVGGEEAAKAGDTPGPWVFPIPLSGR